MPAARSAAHPAFSALIRPPVFRAAASYSCPPQCIAHTAAHAAVHIAVCSHSCLCSYPYNCPYSGICSYPDDPDDCFCSCSYCVQMHEHREFGGLFFDSVWTSALTAAQLNCMICQAHEPFGSGSSTAKNPRALTEGASAIVRASE